MTSDMTGDMTGVPPPAGGIRHVLYVLALLEAGLAVMAALGQLIAMGGNPLYVAVGLAEAVLYVVAGAAAARGRRYGVVILIVCECVRLTGFTLSVLVGLLPWVELPLTVATLTDGLVLPIAVIILAACSLPVRPLPSAPRPVGALR
jgi:hypothetical protein